MCKNIVDNEYYCVKCGNKGLPILRQKGKERELGHLKKLWCLNCQQENNHAEVRPYGAYTYDDFLLEFDYKNFDENGNRILPIGAFKDKLLKEGVIEYET